MIFYHNNGDNQFDTVRKAHDIARELSALKIPVTAAVPMTPEFASQYHTPAYVKALETGNPMSLASSSGLDWNAEYRNAIFGMAGAMLTAAQYSVASGKWSFALTSGAHHARASRGHGFCAINSLAIAALYLARSTDRHIYILDVDAHAGGGTNSFLASEGSDRIHHIDVVTSPYDMYQSHNQTDIMSLVEPFYDDNENEYIEAMIAAFMSSREPEKGDILLVNAGVDVHEDSAIGGLSGMNTLGIKRRENTIRELALQDGMIVVGMLAGGYSGAHFSEEDLANCHIASIRALLGI